MHIVNEKDLEKLNSLSPEEREIALQILKEYADSGQSSIQDQLWEEDFEEIPVDIHTFLHDKKYLGRGLYDQDGRFTLFPYWEKKLEEVFPTNISTSVNTLILTGCLAYDTEIPLLNGKIVKIGELAKQGDLDEYVYSYDVETNQYQPGHLISAFSTGIKPIYEITLDNGTKIKATSNHKFMTRDKHWKSIDTGLSVGDSMMPFNRRFEEVIPGRPGYEVIENPNKDGTTSDIFTHRLVMNWKFGKYKGVVHHADFNKTNNDPRNLVLTNWFTHKMYHAKRGGDRWKEFNEKRANGQISPELEKRILDGALKGCINRWAKSEEHEKMSKITTARMKDGLASDMLDVVWNGPNSQRNRETNSKNLTKANQDPDKINQYQISKAIKISNLALVEYNDLSEKTYEAIKKKYNMRSGYPSFKSILNRISYDELLEQAKLYNHKIISIEYIGEEEVYDLTVEKYHNFAINNGIVAHNSIGIGKSTMAVLCQLYMLYRLLCLKDPYLYYGMQPIDKISISFMNITIENAKGVALDKLNQLILSSEWFMSHGEMHGTTNLKYVPEKHIELICASSNNQIIGRALFCLDGDTLIKTSDGFHKLKDLVDKEIKVISVDENNHEIISEQCVVKPTIKTNEEYQIELEDGTIIKCTGDHRFKLIDGSYKAAKDLTEDDEIAEVTEMTYNEYINSIKKIILPEPKQYYDVIDAAPFHNFIIKTNNSEIISHNCNFSDEVNFDARSTNVERQKARLKQIISQVDARMSSRFLRGNYLPTLNIIASSKASDQSFLDDYINTKRKNQSKTTMIVDEPQWVVDSRKQTGEWFRVAVGDRYLPNEMIPDDVPDEVYLKKGYTEKNIIRVPKTDAYLEAFKTNIELALTDIAGISTAAATKYISGQAWDNIKTDYKNPFTKEIIEVGNGEDDLAQYSDFFDLSAVPSEWKSKPMWIHLDMSSGGLGKGDKTGLAGVWISGRRPNVHSTQQEIEEADLTREICYRVAFSVSIKAPKGRSISFVKHRIFIRWLRDQGFDIQGISCDTWGGPQMQQELQSDGFTVKTVSVDRVDNKTHQQLQYAYFKTTLGDRRIEVYKDCKFLTEEVLGLERLSDGHIQHPDGGRSGSKDQIDAVVGSLWNASQNSDKVSLDTVENVELDLAVNKYKNQDSLDIEEVKEQSNEFFSNVIGYYNPESEQFKRLAREKMEEEYDEDTLTYFDISEGILVI